jgi:hypothetical protein
MSTKKKSLLILLGLALAISVVAKDKPWTQWTDKDAKKILNDSGWGQTQTYMGSVETSQSVIPASAANKGGLVDAAPGVNYRIRFLSAKPIRQAFLRLVQLNPKATHEQNDQAHQFVDTKYDQVVVIAVDYDTQSLAVDGRFTSAVFQAFSGGMTSNMKNNVYLDIKGGQRVFLQEFKPPSGDGVGARFIFPRIVNDKPILDPNSGEVRFYAEFPKMGGNDQVILNMRFKVSNLMYDGVLEY